VPTVRSAAAAGRKAAREGDGTPQRSLRDRWVRLGPGEQKAVVLGSLALLFVAYCGLAHTIGERRAATGLLIGAVPLAFWAGRGEGVASVLLVGMYFGLAVIGLFVAAFGWRIYRAVFLPKRA
jgi:hypothetical protein